MLHLCADALDVELVVPEGVGELRVLIYEGPHLLLHLLQAHLGVLQRDRSVLKVAYNVEIIFNHGLKTLSRRKMHAILLGVMGGFRSLGVDTLELEISCLIGVHCHADGIN